MLNQSQLTPPAEFTYVEEAPSGMDIAVAQAKEGAAHLSSVFTENQTAGRGRRGRQWQGFVGNNIAICFVIRKGTGQQLPLVAALSVQQALAEVGASPSIKWPNDILLDGKKVCGVLVEGIASARAKILGIGINVLTPYKIPTDFAGTFLNQHLPQPTTREQVLNALFTKLEQNLNTFEEQGWLALAEAYNEHCITISQSVRWVSELGELTGTATGLDNDGTLLLTDDDGGQHRITAGDIIAQGQQHT